MSRTDRSAECGSHPHSTGLPGDHSEWVPPDSIPTSEVKPLSADDSVEGFHAKVGNCQALYTKPHPSMGFFFNIPNQRRATSRTVHLFYAFSESVVMGGGLIYDYGNYPRASMYYSPSSKNDESCNRPGNPFTLLFCLSRSVLLFSLVYAPLGQTECALDNPVVPLMVEGYYVEAEIASTFISRRCGLSFRDSLADNKGMLFVYNRDQPLAYWMKDTRIPLSIAFLDRTGMIINIEEMTPMDTKNITRSGRSARYALEMSAQWFLLHGVQQGDQILFDLPGNINIE